MRLISLLGNAGVTFWLLSVTEGTTETVASILGVGIVAVLNYGHGLED